MTGGRYLAKITDLKTDNIHQVRSCFYNGEIWTKNELATTTGLSLAATTNILQLLLKDGEIELVGEAKSTGGRKSKQYIINRDYYHLITITLKRDDQNHYFNIKKADLLGCNIGEKNIVSKMGKTEELLSEIALLIEDDNKISVIALSIPGVCNDGKIDICDFESLEGVDLKDLLQMEFGLSVVMENDVNVASIGLSKQYPAVNNLALMYQPRVKYIGCGLVVNQQLCTGFSNFAGELAYLPFYSHQQQDQLLKTDPNQLLLIQLVTICCVINPQVVALCSDVLDSFDSSKLTNYLPALHCPKIINIDNLDKLIFDGLCSLGIDLLKNKIRKRDN